MLMISLRNVEKDQQHAHARALLRECLKPLGIAFSGEEQLERGKQGKPFLREKPDVHFNLSHAQGITACLVSDRQCGIDCESVREYRPKVMSRAFSGNEQQLVENSAPEQRDLLFFRLWTLKESYVKALGTGLAFPMKEAEFSFDDNGGVAGPAGWKFRQYIIRGRFIVAVCEKE